MAGDMRRGEGRSGPAGNNKAPARVKGQGPCIRLLVLRPAAAPAVAAAAAAHPGAVAPPGGRHFRNERERYMGCGEASVTMTGSASRPRHGPRTQVLEV